jgi:hypothetical protein
MVHITEFTADLIKHGKLDLDPSRNDNLGHLPRFLQPGPGHGHAGRAALRDQNVCNNFYEMPANTIREQTFCCGSGAGLNAGEDMELRMAAAAAGQCRQVCPRSTGSTCWPASAPSTVRPCPHLMEYWVPEVEVTGVHELVANALILPGEKEARNRPARRAAAGNGGVADEGQKKDSRGTGRFFALWHLALLVQHGKGRPAPELELTEKAKAAKNASCPPSL